VYVAVTMLRAREPAPDDVARLPPDAEDDRDRHVEPPRPTDLASFRSAALAHLSGDTYAIRHLGRGVAGSAGAGVVSALLGIGGGIIKVPLMHVGMGVPLRVATATSNLMIGITAAASAVIYLIRGEVDPYVVGPVAIGVFVGASLGSRAAQRIDLRVLNLLFVAVLLWTALQMLLRAVG
jgi:uncharacterized membrane protein YfcA